MIFAHKKKCLRVPEWHQSDSCSGHVRAPESTKKTCSSLSSCLIHDSSRLDGGNYHLTWNGGQSSPNKQTLDIYLLKYSPDCIPGVNRYLGDINASYCCKYFDNLNRYKIKHIWISIHILNHMAQDKNFDN